MFKIKNLVALFVMTLLMQPTLFKAQSPAYRISSSPENTEKTEKKVGWQAAKLNDDGSNVRNGVEFYNQHTECSKKVTSNEKGNSNEKATFQTGHHITVTPDMYISEPVNLLKLVNTNSYAVKVSYQLNELSPVVNILVPPLTTIEGSCGVTDSNLAKLVIMSPVGKTDEEKQKQRNYVKSSIVVTPVR